MQQERASRRAAALVGAALGISLLAGCTAEAPPGDSIARPGSSGEAEPSLKRIARAPAGDPADRPAPVPGDPFDRGAAARALGSTSLAPCQGMAWTGTGHITVTFGTDGTASKVTVDDGPLPESREARCLIDRFSAASVPPFGGTPVRVGKSVTLK